MVDWLVVWGASKARWLLFKPVLEDLAKDATKDWLKDWFKSSLNSVMPLPQKDEFKTAAGKAAKEFLICFQETLEAEDLDDDQIKTFLPAMRQFMTDQTVMTVLGKPFKQSCTQLEITSLARVWAGQNPSDCPEHMTLPESFNWKQLGKKYSRKVTEIRQESDELIKILNSQSQQEANETLQQLQGIPADFDLETYQESLLEQYQNLKLESLDTSGYAYNELKLWRMFIPQSVRECQEFSPKVYELPKEFRQKLQDDGELEADIDEEMQHRMRQAYVDQSPQPILEVVQKSSELVRAVILGDPGSGKSTLLQYLALEWAQGSPQNLYATPVPLLIELRLYARNR